MNSSSSSYNDDDDDNSKNNNCNKKIASINENIQGSKIDPCLKAENSSNRGSSCEKTSSSGFLRTLELSSTECDSSEQV
ncbi:hypothetical protein PoB_005285000 [Plakobranchus ocellatus]|uniref:Uncharacterized protein n=1 Tax=Plakobranchus ocellatus TaxID=259542 RepID=A0AAV4C3Y8_9GAST|nr:hypothetical protein PoB_005285000 [Plakobranchus ocellatus]